MTLVVARRLSRTARLFCDSKVTDREAVRGGYQTGALKAVILGPRLCVAFSGSPFVGVDAVRKLDRLRRLDVNETLDVGQVEQLLLAASKAVGGTTRFLVASLPLRPLARISGDELTHADHLWIGDYEAFHAYQGHLSKPSGMALRAHAETAEQKQLLAEWAGSRPEVALDPGLDEWQREDLTLAARMAEALDDVIADPDVETVGDLSIRVIGDERGFRYLSHAAQFGGPEQTLRPGVQTSLLFGKSAAAGGFGYKVCVPGPGVGAIGVHFPQGRLGVLFHPLTEDAPIQYPGMDQTAFITAVERDHGLRLDGGVGFG